MLSKTNGKGPWSFEEDNKLLDWVKINGPQKWSLCSETIPGRSGKQCRERWFNNLNPNVKKGNWTAEEDDMIFQGYLQHGSSWSRIAQNLEGRTENSVKNRFYSTVRKLLSDSEKNSGKSSEQQIRNIIEMSLGKKVGGGVPFNNNNQDSDKDSKDGSDDEDDRNQSKGKVGQNEDEKNQELGSKTNKSSQEIIHEGESEENNIKKGDESQKSKHQNAASSSENKKKNKSDATSNTKSGMEIENQEGDQKQSKSEGLIKNEKDSKNDGENSTNKKTSENHEDDDESSQQLSSSQQLQGGVMKRKYNRKRHQDEYSESNLLYRLLKSNDVTIKNTKCLQDYSVFYRKYKQNKYMLKKKKKEDEVKDQYGNEHESSQRAESGEDYDNHDEMEDEEIEKQYKAAQQQFMAQNIEKSSKKNSKGKTIRPSIDQRRHSISKDIKHLDEDQDSNQDTNDEHNQMLLLQQKLSQQNKLESKLKKKLKGNISIPEVKIEDQSLNKSTNKYKNIKNSKSKHKDPSSDDEDDEHHQQSMSQENDENDNNSDSQNDDEERDVNSCIPSDNQLDDVGEIEQQLLKYFQKSMGQFFKNFIKKQKQSTKETEKEKKSSKVKEFKKQQAQQQQQLLQLQIQEQIQEQLKQLNNQNGGGNSKQSKNNNSLSQAIQRANTIIQNPPLKNSGGNKKSTSSANPEVASFEKQLQKQIQEIQQKEPQIQNKDLKSSLDTVKINQKQQPGQQNAAQQQQQTQQQQQVVDKSNLISNQNNFQSQKSSFQLKNNPTIASSKGGYHPLGSSSSLFSQPNANGLYGLGNNMPDINSSFHNLQNQQQAQAESSQSAAHNISLENLKSLLTQNKMGGLNSGGQGNQQASNTDQGVDQKMIFLLNQLNTLESMLSNTKKELVKLEASLNSRNGDNFSQQQQQQQQQQSTGRGGGYASNSLQNSSNNLFGQSGFYPFQNGIPLTASLLNTLPSFGSRAAFDKSENGNVPFQKRKNSKDNTSQFSDFDKFINNNN